MPVEHCTCPKHHWILHSKTDNCMLFICLKEDRITTKWCPWGNHAQILRKGRDARVNNRVWPVYALLPGFSQFWEAGPGMVGESRGESLAYSQGINPYGNQSWLTLRNRSPYTEAPCGRAGLVAADSQLRPWYPVSWACQWEQWNPLVSFRVPERTQVVCSPLTDSSWGATEMGDRGIWVGGSCGVQGQVLLLPKKPMLTALSRRQDQGGPSFSKKFFT